MSPLSCVFIFIISKLVEAEVWKFTNGNIVVGAGYSDDSQQMVDQRCYNATISSTSAQQGYIRLDTALAFSELENVLGISVSVGGSYGVFSAEAKASYVRSIQDKDYSMSLNYYQYATNNVAVQLAGYGEEALTESGRGFYNSSKNPYFGLICGDYYINSYQQGAFLTMGLNIKFSSSKAKKEFQEKAGASFFDIVSAAESVKSVVTEYKINGSVIIQAFQMGGEPSQLAQVLNKDSSGQYYALQCSLTAMDKCIKVASGLLDYARNNFSTQFSFQNNTGLTPLGIAFTQYSPIKYIGLITPASLVTPEVMQYRNELYSKLMENEYYQQKFYPFFNEAYPVELDTTFINQASSILSKANRNVEILMQAHKGAADCYNYPDKCASIKYVINSQLQNITIDDLHILEIMKYTFTATGGMFYNTGLDLGSWSAVTVPSKEIKEIVLVHDKIITDYEYLYYIDVRTTDAKVLEYYYDGKTTNTSLGYYVGCLLSRPKGSADWTGNVSYYKEYKLLSPFFFNSYSISK